MTKIEWDLKNGFFELSIVGHAGYGEYGKDIVCSAVSILSFSLYEYLERSQKEGQVKRLTFDGADGMMFITAKLEDEKILEGIKSILIGFEEISKNYKKNVHFSPKGKEFNFSALLEGE